MKKRKREKKIERASTKAQGLKLAEEKEGKLETAAEADLKKKLFDTKKQLDKLKEKQSV